MLSDQRSSYFQRFQAQASVIAIPMQYLANWPVELIEWITASIESQHQVLEENARLRAGQLLLQAKLQRLVALQNENAQLRALLQSSPHVGGEFSVAQLLAVNMDPFIQKVVLDQGNDSKVYVGQPVLDAYGVMGQVVEVGPATSQVLLITDPQSAISVQDGRNGVRAIAAGTGSGLQLVNVPDTADIQEGDLMVTSGLDQRFPQGYPLGIVKKVERDPELRFAKIDLQPSAHIDRSRMVLLIWPRLPAIGATQTTTPTTSTSNASAPNSSQANLPNTAAKPTAKQSPPFELREQLAPESEPTRMESYE